MQTADDNSTNKEMYTMIGKIWMNYYSIFTRIEFRKQTKTISVRKNLAAIIKVTFKCEIIIIVVLV